MTDPLNSIGPAERLNLPGSAGTSPGGKTAPGKFAEIFRRSVDEVNRLQQEADRATESLMLGGEADIGAVMTAVEKADLAFKMLLAIRAKLMEAYDEIKTIQV